MEKITTSQSRRSFLKSSMLASGGLMISFGGLAKFMADGKINPTDLPEEWTELTGYIKITSDNIIKILNPNPEFGQNVMTSLPMIVAEELDVDWKKVVVEMGPHDNAKLGPQFTSSLECTRGRSVHKSRDALS
jgi:isoquinoline 1-oxidoreductase beta subunit